jgi:hypothetical protein
MRENKNESLNMTSRTPIAVLAVALAIPVFAQTEAKAFNKHDAETNTAALRNFNSVDNVKNRPLSERCLIGFGSTSTTPTSFASTEPIRPTGSSGNLHVVERF